MKCNIVNTLNSAEALYAFAGWLTSRKTVITASRLHDAAVWAEAVKAFADSQLLPGVRNDFTDRIKPYPD